MRTVDSAELPSIIKKDCIVLDFGTSTLMQGSLEQEVQLDDQLVEGNAPYKDCPECGVDVPLASKECPLCGYVWEGQPEAYSTQTADFHMTEIDILKRSGFLWCDLHGDDRYFIRVEHVLDNNGYQCRLNAETPP